MSAKAVSLEKAVFLIGPPGSGKGTQANLLEQQAGFRHIDTAKVIAERFVICRESKTIDIEGVSYDCKEERDRFSSGYLMTPEVVVAWVLPEIKRSVEEGKSFVFSGFPRTLVEAEEAIPFVIDLVDKENITVIHLAGHRDLAELRKVNELVCSSCSASVSESIASNICSICGGDLVKRSNLDSSEVVAVRLGEYAQRTKPVLEYFADLGLVVYDVDIANPVEEIFVEVLASAGAKKLS